MAVSGSEMEAPAMVKWEKMLWRSEREREGGERERASVEMRKKKKTDRVLTNCFYLLMGFPSVKS